jgi:hypothetical protein
MKRGPDQPELTLYRHMDARQQQIVREAYFVGRTDGYRLGYADGVAKGLRTPIEENAAPADEIRGAVEDMRKEGKLC